MRRHRLSSFGCGLALAAIASLALADDTDIYINPINGLAAGSEPMVMFSLDYRPNLAATACLGNECDTLIAEGYLPAIGPYTFFDVLRASLKKVFEPLEGVRVGLMLNHDNINDCAGPLAREFIELDGGIALWEDKGGCSNGGYIAMGPQLFELGDTNGAKQTFHDILAAIPLPLGGQSHSYQGKELFFELFRMLTGQRIYNGHNGWVDYFTDNLQNLNVDGAAYDWDATIEDGEKYRSPLGPAGACTSLYTVNMLFQVSNQEADSDVAIEAPVAEGGFGASKREFPDVIRYMYDADLGNGSYGDAPDLDGKQNVTSYFMVDPRFINKTTLGYAQAGGTGAPLPLSDDPDELVATLQEIFRQVLSVSTTFVAGSVPVNVFNRAERVDNVYIALFQVDEDAQPNWQGNVKKLRLGAIDNTPVLLDALGQPAIAGDGRIRNDALTYWTLPGDLPPPDIDDGEVAARDGRFVERGGAGHRLPGFISGSPGATNLLGRELFYDDGGSLSAFNADVATATALQADLGAADVTEAQELIAFARGLDIDDLDGDGTFKEARPWIFSDALHSRPVPINYGARGSYTVDNPAIFLAVGSNDGVLHFLRNTTTAGAESGEEIWGFVPRSGLGAQKILRADGRSVPHPYTVDGAPVSYLEDTNNSGTIEPGERAFVFFGMRRGGKAYYGLDISDPLNPSLLWSIEKGGDFAELGYTFSTPRVGKVNLGAGPIPVLIFAGGYDMNKDTRGVVGTDDTEGNAIFVVNAETGDLIWKARRGNAGATSTTFDHPDLVDSIPSTVAIGDTDGDLLTDRIVVGDTGGNIWRADLHGSNTSAWKLTRLASLGRHAEAGKAGDRRFFHRPDLVQAEDGAGLFDAVLIGSGDRPDPLDAGGLTTNWLYMIKDRHVAPGTGTDVAHTPNDLGDVTDNCLQSGGGGGACGVNLANGWKLQLETPGEKSLATPITIAGHVFFTTYIPASSNSATGACAPAEGSGRLYALSLQDATAVINYDTTDDDPNYEGEATTKSDRFSDLASPGIPSEVVSIPPNMIVRPDLQIETLDVTTRWRTFWYLEEDADL